MRRLASVLLASLLWLASASAQLTTSGVGGGFGPSGGGGTVTVDGTPPATVVNTTTTSLTQAVTVSGSAGGAVVAQVAWSLSAKPAGTITATYNGSTMTAVPGTDSGTNGGCTCAVIMYAILAPASGTHNVVISWTGNVEGHLSSIALLGVNQGSIAAAFPNGTFLVNNLSTASPITQSIASATGHIVLASGTEQTSPFGTINGTTIAKDDTTGPNLTFAANYNSGAATVSPSIAFGSASVWSFVGTDVSP